MFQLSLIGQSNLSPYRLIWKKFVPLYKLIYSLSSRKQGWSVQKKKNIYKSRLWCQINEIQVMNHVLGWEGCDFHYHNWPISLFALTILIPLTHFKLKRCTSEKSHFEVSLKCPLRQALEEEPKGLKGFTCVAFCVKGLMFVHRVHWGLKYFLLENEWLREG